MIHLPNLYLIAKEFGMSDSEIAEDVTLLMAGVAEIHLQQNFKETNPMFATVDTTATFIIPNLNPKSNVENYQITVDRLVQSV